MVVNVAMLTTWKTRCGIATYSEKLASALAKQGVNVYIVRLPRFGYKDPSIYQNIVDSIPLDKIDIIHVQHEYGLFSGVDRAFQPAVAKLGKPVVTTMHAVGSWENDQVIGSTSERIIVHNEHCRGIFTRINAPDVAAKVVVIPHGMTPLQTPLPPRDACKRRLGIQPEAPIVGYCGYISHYKGLESLIDAMAGVPNAALLIGGGWFVESETNYIVSLREKAHSLLPNRCQWLGYVAEEDLPLVYGAMDVVVYPSRMMTESGAMLLALSHGKALIANDLPPVREKEKKGALMTFKDIPDLTEKIKLLLTDKVLQAQYEDYAKRFTEENSWANIAKQHASLYESMLHV